MQNDDGYVIISGDEPSDDLLKAVESEISSSPMKCGQKGHELMRFGLKLPEEAWFQEYLGCSYSQGSKHGETRIMSFDNKRFGRFVPGPPGTILIFRAATRQGLSSDRGFFKIVPGSHRMTAAQIKRARSVSITLIPKDILFLVANTTVEYLTSGGCVAICEAVSSPLKSYHDDGEMNS